MKHPAGLALTNERDVSLSGDKNENYDLYYEYILAEGGNSCPMIRLTLQTSAPSGAFFARSRSADVISYKGKLCFAK